MLFVDSIMRCVGEDVITTESAKMMSLSNCDHALMCEMAIKFMIKETLNERFVYVKTVINIMYNSHCNFGSLIKSMTKILSAVEN